MDGDGTGTELDEEWPPREARVRAAIWQGEGHLLRGEWVHGARTLAGAVGSAEHPDVVRGLRLLCAAGYQARDGDLARARAQVARARRRLAPYLPAYEEVDLEAVIAAVEAAVEGHAGE